VPVEQVDPKPKKVGTEDKTDTAERLRKSHREHQAHPKR
jgi:hypothetical protein